MKKIKEFFYSVMASITTDAYFASKSTKGKMVAGGIVGSGILTGATTCALAAEGFDVKLGNMLKSAYMWILGISTGLAIVLIAVAIIRYICASDPQAAKAAKDTAKRVIIGWVLINLLGSIATVIKTLVSGSNYNNVQGQFDGWSSGGSTN